MSTGYILIFGSKAEMYFNIAVFDLSSFPFQLSWIYHLPYAYVAIISNCEGLFLFKFSKDPDISVCNVQNDVSIAHIVQLY